MDIPRDLLQQVYDHGLGAYPEEACGVLSGPSGDDALVTGFHPMENAINRLHSADPERYPRTAREGYVLDPGELMRLEKHLGAENRELRVIFHTHIDVGAYFSEEDREQAMWGEGPRYPGVVYLVCGVRQKGTDGAIVAEFNEADGTFDETRIDAPHG